MDCPSCGLVNLPEATRCACGCPLDGALALAFRKRPPAACPGRGRGLRIALLVVLAAALAVVRLLAAGR
jgi:hypothetical protein